MPLAPFQQRLLADLASEPPDDLGYIAGGAALHFEPNSARFSRDLGFFHDAVERVAAAFARDSARLEAAGYTNEVTVSQPGFVRAIVSRGGEATRVDWAHDSAWRSMPLVRDAPGGLMLHPVDLAINKVLALVGRDEPVAAKDSWRAALETADAFCRSRPPDEIGCLYWSRSRRSFVMPASNAGASDDVVPHYGTRGGVLPRVSDASA